MESFGLSHKLENWNVKEGTKSPRNPHFTRNVRFIYTSEKDPSYSGNINPYREGNPTITNITFYIIASFVCSRFLQNQLSHYVYWEFLLLWEGICHIQELDNESQMDQ